MKLIRYETVDSTFEEAGRIAPGLPDGEYLLLAREQTEGRGQGRRSFFSERGNGVFATLLIVGGFTEADTGKINVYLTPLTAVCATECVRKMTGYGERLTVKWVNDLMLDNRKYGGILSACSMMNGIVTHVRIGYGINTGDSAFPDELSQRAVSLKLDDSDKNEKLALDIAGSICAEMHPDSIDTLRDRYRGLCSTVGKTVLLADGRYGKADGITPDFLLSVRLPDGSHELLRNTAGTVII